MVTSKSVQRMTHGVRSALRAVLSTIQWSMSPKEINRSLARKIQPEPVLTWFEFIHPKTEAVSGCRATNPRFSSPIFPSLLLCVSIASSMPAYCSIQFLTGLPGSSVTLSRQPNLLPVRPAAWKPSALTSKEVKMELTLTRPDDWHLHLRDGDLLQAVVPHSASHFARAIVMPNLKPPITTTAAAVAYRESILKALPPNSGFDPLMTLYLTDNTSPEEIKLARRSGVVFAVKLYPAGATTNSQDGVTDVFGKCLPVLEEMVEQTMPLLVGKIQMYRHQFWG